MNIVLHISNDGDIEQFHFCLESCVRLQLGLHVKCLMHVGGLLVKQRPAQEMVILVLIIKTEKQVRIALGEGQNTA